MNAIETPYNSVIAAPAPRRTHAAQHPAAPRRPAQRLGALAAPALKPSHQGQHQRQKGALTGPYSWTRSRATPRPKHQDSLHTPLFRSCPKLRSRAAAECASRPRGAARARGAARMTPPARPPTRRGARSNGSSRIVKGACSPKELVLRGRRLAAQAARSTSFMGERAPRGKLQTSEETSLCFAVLRCAGCAGQF